MGESTTGELTTTGNFLRVARPPPGLLGSGISTTELTSQEGRGGDKETHRLGLPERWRWRIERRRLGFSRLGAARRCWVGFGMQQRPPAGVGGVGGCRVARGLMVADGLGDRRIRRHASTVRTTLKRAARAL